MQSNFEFLKLNVDEDLQELYPLAVQVEKSYVNEMFSPALIAIRTSLEHAARMLADQHFLDLPFNSTFNDVLRLLKRERLVPQKFLDIFYDLKNKGNEAAHEALTQFAKQDVLKALKEFYETLVWLVNTEYDQKVQLNFKEPVKEKLYQTMAERKLVYVQTANNSDGMWPAYEGLEKIGEASSPEYEMEADWSPNSNYLRQVADKRINQYMRTSGVPYVLEWTELAWNKKKHEWFHDYDVHEVLQRSHYDKADKVTGAEWFKIDLETAKKAIAAVKEGKSAIDGPQQENQIILRPEQEKAVEQTQQIFKKPGKMLWNAKMRFGKTVAALQLIKEEKYKKVLIMTHRPVVSDSWFTDFGKMEMSKAGYRYGSKNKGEQLGYLVESENPFIYFASIQDLRGSTEAGGKQGDKNELIFSTQWDLVIIDEAHEGTQTDLAHNVLDLVTNDQTRTLELSGTPFNLIDDYDEEHVFTWDYVMEQEAKTKWQVEHPNEKNPYEKLPKVSMYTFAMKNRDYLDEQKSFNFKEFFRTEEDGSFAHEQDVNNFLNEITTQDEKTNYPYSTQTYRDELRHTLWLVPGVKEAKALTDLLRKHPVFGKEYKIINVVDNDKSDTVESVENDDRGQSDVERVRKVITDKAYQTKTITISVRRLTTGVNVPEWTAIMFLNNTTSAMQYLQAAFRAQTPYSDEKGMKENCYIFDFAPDRALTVMAESTSLNTGAGKLVSGEQKEAMKKLLNFLPIIGMHGNEMKEYHVDKLLTQIKRVYAEKAVRSGFDDDSLYSDELLKLDEADLSDFKNLQAIVGSTKKTKLENKVAINDQGLSDEEYDTAERGRKKKKKERTPEEQEVIDKMNALKKQKKTMVSVLRGISIRIPLMIYGMKADLADDITLDKFIKLVDQQSWEEFMPKGITKGEFAKFKKYYDPEVFIEAGRIIRRKVKQLDTLEPIERAEELAIIFGTFKNPDKETVLTPWNVVNRHLTSTIGGLSFFDDNFETMRDGNVPLNHWVETNETTEVFKPDTKILEINSKTGLYPLYAAVSLYWKAFAKLNSDQAGKFTAQDEDNLWQKVLTENVHVLAKTPMAKTIAERTLAGYRDFKTNVQYIDGIVEIAKDNIDNATEKVKEAFGNMKFDVVIGNPPYQESDGGARASATPVYQHFVRLAKKLSTSYVTLIIPARWFVGGKGLDDFRDEMLTDNHLKQLYDFKNPEDLFPKTNIRGGISIFLRDDSYVNSKKGVRVITVEHNQVKSDIYRPLKTNDIDIFIRDIEALEILNKISYKNGSIEEIASPRKPFGFGGSFINDKRFFSNEFKLKDPIKVYGKSKSGFVERKEIKSHLEWVDQYKVFTARANNIGTELNDDNLNTIVGKPKEIVTETYIVIGGDINLDNNTARNLAKYLRTKFVRYLVSLAKSSQDAARSTYRFVPIQNFNNDEIDWSKTLREIDEQLFNKYKLNKTERNKIETSIQDLTSGEK